MIKITKSDLRNMVKEAVVNFLKEDDTSTYNNAPMVSINEGNASTLINKHSKSGYVIISACRGGADFNLNPNIPQDKQKLSAINKERSGELVSLIRKAGFTYTPAYGGFIENKGEPNQENVYERSFIIYPYDRSGHLIPFENLKDFALNMCKKYNQDSVLVKEPNKQPVYLKSDGSIDFEFSNEIAFNDLMQTYFTDLHKNTHKSGDISGRKPTRFTFLESYINPEPQCYSERFKRDMQGEIFIGI